MVKLYQNSVFAGIILVVSVALLNRGGGPLTSHLVLTIIVFGIAFFGFLLRKKLSPKPPDILEIILLLFLLFFLLSFIFSLTKNFGLNELLLYTNAVVLILLIRRINFSETQISNFKTALVFLMLLESLAGVFIYIGFAFPRFGGTFLDLKAPHTSFANDFANFSILLLPLCFEKYFQSRRASGKILFGLISAIVFSSFLLSFSRGAWLSFFVAITAWVSWLIFYYRADFLKRIRYFMPHAAALILVTFILVSIFNFARAQNFQVNSFWGKAAFQADEGASSIKERLDFWKGAVQIIKERPLFGSGILSFKFLYPKYQPDFGANWDHPHNIFLKIGVENGLPAAILFFAFLIIFAWKFLKNSAKSPATIPLMIGALGAFGHNLVDYNFIVSNFTLFAVFLGLGLMLMQDTERGRFSTTSATRKIIPLVFLISTILLFIGLHEGYYNYFFKNGRFFLAKTYWELAQTNLEKAQKLFWQRDLSLYLAVLYREQGNINKEEEILRKQILESAVDASIINRLGEIAFAKGDKSTALNYFEQAISMDPKNHLRYYYNFLITKSKANLVRFINKTILPLLTEYEGVLRKNAHFTIGTDNPRYAIKIYEYLEGVPQKIKWLYKIWDEETFKYIDKYHTAPKFFSL